MSHSSIIIFLMFISVCRSYMCPDYCECEDSIVNCICTVGSETISLRTPIPEKTKAIHVANCSRVELSMAATAFGTYEKMEFVNIGFLSISPFALTGVSISSRLLIENITKLMVESYGFSGLNSVRSLQIRSVKADIVKDFAFSGLLDINEIVIANSIFHELGYLAFHVKNATSFRIENCVIGRVVNTSFELLDMKEIVINKSVIQNVETEGFSISTVDYFAIHTCEFGSLYSRAFVTENVTEFVFHNCAVSESKSDAFLLVKAKRGVTFSDNVIDKAWNNSILPNRGLVSDVQNNGLQLIVENNEFTCDCDIAWMWDQRMFYEDVIGTSFCIDVLNTTISLLKPLLDNDGNCTELDFAKNDTNGTPSFSADKMLLRLGMLLHLFLLTAPSFSSDKMLFKLMLLLLLEMLLIFNRN